MGALNGSLSYMRFLVEGEPPKNPGTAFEKSLESRRFMPLSPGADTPESGGWVASESPFDDDLPLTRDLFLFGDLVAITYREDKWAIPRQVLKREVARRVKKIVDEEGKDPDTLSKAFMKAVEDAVLSELKQKTMPRTKLVDVVWDMQRSEARVFGRGTVVTERVASLFERTFKLKVDIGPWAARAFSLDIGSRAMSVLERLSPGWLFPDAFQNVDDEEVREKLVEADDDEAAVAPPVDSTLATKPKSNDDAPWN